MSHVDACVDLLNEVQGSEMGGTDGMAGWEAGCLAS